jgi:hypothetical protein
MRDLALQAAGVLAILVAIAHSIIVERKVFARVRVEPQRTRGLLRMLCPASTIDWIGIGVLLIATPALGSDAARLWIIAVAVIVYGYAAIGNAVATRAAHRMAPDDLCYRVRADGPLAKRLWMSDRYAGQHGYSSSVTVAKAFFTRGARDPDAPKGQLANGRRVPRLRPHKQSRE